MRRLRSSLFAEGGPRVPWSRSQPSASLSSISCGSFRFWNIVQYWFPYRDVMDEDWDGVLREFIAVMIGSMDGDAYRLALIQLIARIHDTHANIWSDLQVQPPVGTDEAPLVMRWPAAERHL